LSWSWIHRDHTIKDDASKTSLTFTDVIFGLVITQIFVQAVPYSKLQPEVLLHLGLALVVVIGSYIGYRKSLKRRDVPLSFFSWPLIRFGLDLAMIFCYYLLAVTPNTSTNPALKSVDPKFDATMIAIIFLLYLLWDVVSGIMSHSYEVKYEGSRTAITVGALVLCLLVLWMAHHLHRTTNETLGIDAALIGIVLLYRWAKDSQAQPKKEEPPPPGSGLGPPPLKPAEPASPQASV
jgi:hypothetical protein